MQVAKNKNVIWNINLINVIFFGATEILIIDLKIRNLNILTFCYDYFVWVRVAPYTTQNVLIL